MKPLEGLKIVITRARSQAGRFARALEGEGAEVIEFPAIEVVPTGNPAPFGPGDRFDWGVFTSANAVRFFVDALELAGRNVAHPPFDRCCAIGPATREVLESLHFEVNLVAEDFIAEGLIAALSDAEETLEGKSFLVPRGNLADDRLPNALKFGGAEVSEWTVYRNQSPPRDPKVIGELLEARPGLVTFTSGSTARNFCALLGEDALAAIKETAAFASIGPRTTEEAEACGLAIAVEPERHDIPGIVEAIVKWKTAE